MNLMYTEEELAALQSQISRRRIFMLAVAAVMAAGITFFVIRRNEIATSALTIVMLFWIVFFYGMGIKPISDMVKHVDNLLHGKTHELISVYDRFDDAVSLVDGVRYHAVYTIEDREGELEPVERLFYFDETKPFPALEKGDKVRIIYHDREIGLIEKAA